MADPRGTAAPGYGGAVTRTDGLRPARGRAAFLTVSCLPGGHDAARAAHAKGWTAPTRGSDRHPIEGRAAARCRRARGKGDLRRRAVPGAAERGPPADHRWRRRRCGRASDCRRPPRCNSRRISSLPSPAIAPPRNSRAGWRPEGPAGRRGWKRGGTPVVRGGNPSAHSGDSAFSGEKQGGRETPIPSTDDQAGLGGAARLATAARQPALPGRVPAS